MSFSAFLFTSLFSLFLSIFLLLSRSRVGFRLALAPAVLGSGHWTISVAHTRPRFFVRVGQITAGLNSSAVKENPAFLRASAGDHVCRL